MTAYPFLFAGLVFGADQVTKAIVASRLVAGESGPAWSCLRIRHAVTRFPSRGLMHNGALLLLWGAALAGIVLATRSGYFFRQPPAQMALGAALAGAASNLYDRLRRGAVVDFLHLGWWPTFNLADVAITLGAVAAIWFV